MKKSQISLYFFVLLGNFQLNSAILYLINETDKDLYIKEFEFANFYIEDSSVVGDFVINDCNNSFHSNNFLLNSLKTSFYKLRRGSTISIKVKDNANYYLAISAECKINTKLTTFNTKGYFIINSKNYINKKELNNFLENNSYVSGSGKFLEGKLFKGNICAAIYKNRLDKNTDKNFYFVSSSKN